MVWPAAIERALSAIEEAPFLTFQQKRDILYNNAARFLRLTEQQRAQHLKDVTAVLRIGLCVTAQPSVAHRGAFFEVLLTPPGV